jgi:hypothetical protein
LRKLGKVDRSIQITVDDQPTYHTLKDPNRQGQLGFHDPTARTGLGGRIEGTGLDQPPTRPSRLIAKLAAQLPPPGIGDRASEWPVAHQTSYVQTLDHDCPVGTGQLAGELVEPIAAHVGHSRVGAGDPDSGLLPAR